MSDPYVGGRFTVTNTGMPQGSYNLMGNWNTQYATPDIYPMSGAYIYISRAGYYAIRAVCAFQYSRQSDIVLFRMDTVAGTVLAGQGKGDQDGYAGVCQIEFEAHFTGQTLASYWPNDCGLRFYGYHEYPSSLTYDGEVCIRRVGP